LRASALAPGCLIAALALGNLLACASQSPPRERSVLLGAEKRVFLILPLNVTSVLPPELEFLSPIVWEELEVYLRAHDEQLKTVSRETARKLWLPVRSGEKGAKTGYDDAVRALVLELQKHAAFDAMIVPSLIFRKALVSNRSAHWDHVDRDLDYEARGLEARNLAATPLEGVAPASSLHVAVFDAKGEKLHEAKGGLELLVRVRVEGTDASGEPNFRLVPRADLDQIHEHVREGIAAAFQPFLSPVPE
jgi:hypothetical protein